MTQNPTSVIFRPVSGQSKSDIKLRWQKAWVILGFYFLLFVLLEFLIGPFASISAFLPALLWAIWLGRIAGLLVGLLLLLPNILILTQLSDRNLFEVLPFLIGGHALIGVVSYIVGDVFALRRNLANQLAEREASEMRYRALFDHTNDAILLIGLDLIIETVNERAAKLFGFSIEELVGMDYHLLVAPEEQEDLRERLSSLLEGEILPVYERTFFRKNGVAISVEVNAALVYDASGKAFYVQSICRDITDRKAAEEILYFQASHDDLTGLYNRLMFFELLNQAVERAKRQGQKLAVLFMDLDKFKRVNDSLGHAVGDLLLKAVSKRLQETTRSGDAVARIGGDEFAVVLEALDSIKAASDVAAKIESALGLPYLINNHSLDNPVSVGIAVFPDDETDPLALLDRADNEMYKVKQRRNLARQPD
jgi:diguanylate cyclase (GGDEF)-like protein/PAS domain S-box-containing protein